MKLQFKKKTIDKSTFQSTVGNTKSITLRMTLMEVNNGFIEIWNEKYLLTYHNHCKRVNNLTWIAKLQENYKTTKVERHTCLQCLWTKSPVITWHRQKRRVLCMEKILPLSNCFPSGSTSLMSKISSNNIPDMINFVYEQSNRF